MFPKAHLKNIVLSTLRQAADKDFQPTIISDCCMDLLFPIQAEVVLPILLIIKKDTMHILLTCGKSFPYDTDKLG